MKTAPAWNESPTRGLKEGRELLATQGQPPTDAIINQPSPPRFRELRTRSPKSSVKKNERVGCLHVDSIWNERAQPLAVKQCWGRRVSHSSCHPTAGMAWNALGGRSGFPSNLMYRDSDPKTDSASLSQIMRHRPNLPVIDRYLIWRSCKGSAC